MFVKLLSVAVIATTFAIPAFACEQHKTHAAVTTAEAAPVILPPTEEAQPLPQSTVSEEAAISVTPEATATPFGYGCDRARKQTTVYLTN